MPLVDRKVRWLVCFFAGFVGAVLFSLSSSAPVSAQTVSGSSANAFSMVNSYSPSLSAHRFDEVAASHREPNFYQ